jgi:hypothetical protein
MGTLIHAEEGVSIGPLVFSNTIGPLLGVGLSKPSPFGTREAYFEKLFDGLKITSLAAPDSAPTIEHTLSGYSPILTPLSAPDLAPTDENSLSSWSQILRGKGSPINTSPCFSPDILALKWAVVFWT